MVAGACNKGSAESTALESRSSPTTQRGPVRQPRSEPNSDTERAQDCCVESVQLAVGNSEEQVGNIIKYSEMWTRI